MKQSNKRWLMSLLGACVLSLAGGTVSAQQANAEIQSRYQQEVERCHSGASGQTLETCLKEAAAAKGEAQRNQLGSSQQSADYERNQFLRCQVFKDEAERRSCIERNRQTPIKGTVEGGGVLREYIEIIPGNPAAPR